MDIYLLYSASKSLNWFQNLVRFLVSYEQEIAWSFIILTISWTSICLAAILDHDKLGNSITVRWNQKQVWTSYNPAQCLTEDILLNLFSVTVLLCKTQAILPVTERALQWALGLGLHEGALLFFPIKSTSTTFCWPNSPVLVQIPPLTSVRLKGNSLSKLKASCPYRAYWMHSRMWTWNSK